MIGVFDSGEGGENASLHLRAMSPEADITLFLDRESSPFGTKSEAEITAITDRGIERLAKVGCDVVLIACCTAGTVHSGLCPENRRISFPIIAPTAKEALRASSGKIAVLATDATVRSHAFARCIGRGRTAEIEASPLVGYIEGGERDGRISASLGEYLDGLAQKIEGTGADTLVLGCTHFERLSAELLSRISALTDRKISLINSALIGASAILARYPRAAAGRGRTVRI